MIDGLLLGGSAKSNIIVVLRLKIVANSLESGVFQFSVNAILSTCT